ncbi:MAG: Hsp20/alpha crystallin family protein [Nitrospirales bacterium]
MLIRQVKRWPFENQLNGFSELDRLRRDFSQFLTTRGGQVGLDSPAGVYPFLNVTQDQDNFYIRSEVPGMTLDELDVSVTGRNVTVSGERKIPSEDQQVRYHRQEREAGKFRRQFNLPTDVENDKVEARYRHGMLMIVLPKAESAKPRKISING